MTKPEADDVCRSSQSNLLEIDSEQENTFIRYKIDDLIGQEYLPQDYNHPLFGNKIQVIYKFSITNYF